MGSATVLFLGLVENLGFALESPGAGHANNRLKFLEGGRDILANGTHGLDETEKSFLGEDFKKKKCPEWRVCSCNVGNLAHGTMLPRDEPSCHRWL